MKWSHRGFYGSDRAKPPHAGQPSAWRGSAAIRRWWPPDICPAPPRSSTRVKWSTSPGLVMLATGWISRLACRASAARKVSSWWARCSGLGSAVNNAVPTHLAEEGAQFVRSVATGAEIVVDRLLIRSPGYPGRSYPLGCAGSSPPGVRRHGAEDFLGFAGRFGSQRSVTVMVARSRFGRAGRCPDRSQVRPKSPDTSRVIGIGCRPSGQTHVFHDAVVVCFGEEALSGLKPPFISSSRSQIWRVRSWLVKQRLDLQLRQSQRIQLR